MKINIAVKQLGKKHPLIAPTEVDIEEMEPPHTLRKLVETIVQQQVEQYNQKNIENDEEGTVQQPLNNYLSILTDTGKAGFNNIYNQNKANLAEAQSAAIQAFEDGLFSVFLNDEELRHLDEEILLAPDSILIFIRLTFLAGSFW